jgi:hypothetical protein
LGGGGGGVTLNFRKLFENLKILQKNATFSIIGGRHGPRNPPIETPLTTIVSSRVQKIPIAFGGNQKRQQWISLMRKKSKKKYHERGCLRIFFFFLEKRSYYKRKKKRDTKDNYPK